MINLSEWVREGETREVELEGRDLLHFDERNVPPERNKKAAPNPRKKGDREIKKRKGRGDFLRTNWVLLPCNILPSVLPLCLYSIPPFCWRCPVHKYFRNHYPFLPSPPRTKWWLHHLSCRSLHLPHNIQGEQGLNSIALPRLLPSFLSSFTPNFWSKSIQKKL